MSRWHNLAYQFFKRLTDFIFRYPSWPVRMIGWGVILILGGLGIGGLTGVLTWIGQDRGFSLEIETAGSDLPLYWSMAVIFLGFGLVILGAVFGVCDHIQEKRFASSRRVIVIEHRGLRQSVDTPLIDAVPGHIKGQCDAIPIDHRQATTSSHISNPEEALSQIVGLRQQLRQRREAEGPGNINLVYGGMAPVPLTFLTGMMIDNEANLTLLDWDRFESRWRELDGADDGERLTIDGMDDLPIGVTEVGVAIAISYPSDAESIRNTVGDLPLVLAYLPTPSTSAHWSEEKQTAIAREFTDLLGKLLEKNIKRAHLFIAAPNSVVFTLGRHYDDRLHPDAAVYQYERSASPPFPWAIQMPTHGHSVPTIVRTRS